MELVTERLILREMVEEDWRALHAIESDPEIARYLMRDVLSEDDALMYVQEIRFAAMAEPRVIYDLAVTRRDDAVSPAAMIGRCGMRRGDPEPREAMVWYVVAPSHHGHGYASEAVRAMLGYAFEEIGLHRVYGDCDPRNPASARVMEKVGMRREAHFIENADIKGEWCDSLIYAMLRREWLASKVPA